MNAVEEHLRILDLAKKTMPRLKTIIVNIICLLLLIIVYTDGVLTLIIYSELITYSDYV